MVMRRKEGTSEGFPVWKHDDLIAMAAAKPEDEPMILDHDEAIESGRFPAAAVVSCVAKAEACFSRDA
jgi:hypothetical protein